MRIQDLIIEENTDATEAFFHAVRKIPADKLNWKPTDSARSALEIAKEVALSTYWPMGLMTPGTKFEMTPEIMAEFTQRRDAIQSLDEAESVAKAGLEALNKEVATIPDEHLTQTMWMPFGKSNDWPIHKVAGIYASNARYHIGQINYIQTCYGDMSMD